MTPYHIDRENTILVADGNESDDINPISVKITTPKKGPIIQHAEANSRTRKTQIRHRFFCAMLLKIESNIGQRRLLVSQFFTTVWKSLVLDD